MTSQLVWDLLSRRPFSPTSGHYATWRGHPTIRSCIPLEKREDSPAVWMSSYLQRPILRVPIPRDESFTVVNQGRLHLERAACARDTRRGRLRILPGFRRITQGHVMLVELSTIIFQLFLERCAFLPSAALVSKERLNTVIRLFACCE